MLFRLMIRTTVFIAALMLADGLHAPRFAAAEATVLGAGAGGA